MWRNHSFFLKVSNFPKRRNFRDRMQGLEMVWKDLVFEMVELLLIVRDAIMAASILTSNVGKL